MKFRFFSVQHVIGNKPQFGFDAVISNINKNRFLFTLVSLIKYFTCTHFVHGCNTRSTITIRQHHHFLLSLCVLFHCQIRRLFSYHFPISLPLCPLKPNTNQRTIQNTYCKYTRLHLFGTLFMTHAYFSNEFGV